jgi:hypothetical protein
VPVDEGKKFTILRKLSRFKFEGISQKGQGNGSLLDIQLLLADNIWCREI